MLIKIQLQEIFLYLKCIIIGANLSIEENFSQFLGFASILQKKILYFCFIIEYY